VNFTDYVFSPPYFGWLLLGLTMTLVITIASAVLAVAFAFLILRCHLSEYRALRWAGAGYVVALRNLPLVPLLLFLTFVTPHLWYQVWHHAIPRRFEIYVLIFGLALNTAAYLSEILRAGVRAVVVEQVHVARTLGLSSSLVRVHVVYPQAIRVTAPALASRFIHNMKNSTLALIVPLPVDRMELAGQAGRIAGQTFSWAEPLLFVAVVHLGLALGLGWILNCWASAEQKKIEAAL
jgi:His/Glu/Gln/Arg/opine family amino acid ABC transporter permease subunit